jgi:hypothetical protein
MKKLSITLITWALPFLLVWAAFLLTGFSFNPINVFQDGTFWGFSILYWLVWTCLIASIVDIVDETVKQTTNY